MQTLPQKASQLLASVLFPDTCLACRTHVAARGTLCPDCWGEVHFIDAPFCAVTGLPFQHEFGEAMISAEALANPPPYRRARAAVVHAGVARQLVHRLKYADHAELAPWMASWMVRAAGPLCTETDIVVPVPLHRRRFLLRRYNQAAELARAVARQSVLPFAPEALRRVKATQRQVGLSARERHANVRGAFAVPAAFEIEVAGRSVLLIDDVYTTGATIVAAARALMKAGAAHVDVLTFSRVVPHFTSD
ncbi:ComF family protein [Oricola sp.]|uniref:ComF family protein n=1 Tax=Oricola sp. TaxID=1979950 RepID=UPI003BA9BBCF